MAVNVVGETKVIIDRHIEALMRRDIDALVEGYSEDAVFLGNMTLEPVRGRAALRAFWSQALQVFTPEVLSSLRFSQQQVEGNVCYLLWSAGEAMPFGSDTFLVSDGKIVAQTGTVQFGGPSAGNMGG